MKNASPKAKAGVMGWPVSHSLSPVLHGYWLKRYGIEGEYLPLAVPPEELERTLRTLPQKGFRGVNLTVPHKERALGLMDELDETAKKIGSVNTVAIKGKKLIGSNTDAYGFHQNLAPHLSPQGKKALMIGAGGAARSVAYALITMGFAEIYIINRTAARAEALATMSPKLKPISWKSYPDAMKEVALLVNTTTQGMQDQPPLDISLRTLAVGAVVTDIVYTPLLPPLLCQAKELGYSTVDGLDMLLWQAKPGFAAWFGKDPEVDEDLRQHMLTAMAS